MILKYVFLKKESNNRSFEYKEEIIKLINSVFKINDDGKIVFEKNQKYISIDFFIKRNIVYFSVNNKASLSAEGLSYIHEIFTKGEHRKNYYISLIQDDASQYYSNKIYPLFNGFERSLRQMLYLLLADKYGNEWIKHIDSDMKNNLKSKNLNVSKIIEDGLQEMTLSEIESFLFTEYRLNSCDTVVNSLTDMIENDQIDFEYVKTTLVQNKPMNLWNRLFSESYKLGNVDLTLEEIRKYRNVIAHNKLFHYEDYKKCKIILNNVINKIWHAIELIEEKKYKQIDYLKSLQEISECMGKTMLKLQENIKPIVETLNKIYSGVVIPNLEPINKNIYKQLQGLSDSNSIIENNKKKRDSH